jgi:hypothetical protein
MGVVADRLALLKRELQEVRLQLREAQDQLARAQGRLQAMDVAIDLVAVDVGAENT